MASPAAAQSPALEPVAGGATRPEEGDSDDDSSDEILFKYPYRGGECREAWPLSGNLVRVQIDYNGGGCSFLI